MTRRDHRHPMRWLPALCLAVAGLFPRTPARADPVGTALVIGVSARGSACGPAAHSLRDRLTAQGIAVQAVYDPSVIALRSALEDFAAQVEDTHPATALIYVCGPAVARSGRVFLLPADADGPADPDRQGVVLQVLFNVLAGTEGTVYADLGSLAAPEGAKAAETLGAHLPPGLHLALSTTPGGTDASIGQRLARDDFSAAAGWDIVSTQLQPGAPDPKRVTILLPPAPAPAPPPVAPDPAPPPAAAVEPPPEPPASPPAVAAAPPIPLPEAPKAAKPTRSAAARPPQRLPPHEEPGSDRIRRLQTALARAGYAGPIDGRINPSTSDAIRAYQRHLGDSGTGVLTQSELVQLLNH